MNTDLISIVGRIRRQTVNENPYQVILRILLAWMSLLYTTNTIKTPLFEEVSNSLFKLYMSADPESTLFDLWSKLSQKEKYRFIKSLPKKSLL